MMTMITNQIQMNLMRGSVLQSLCRLNIQGGQQRCIEIECRVRDNGLEKKRRFERERPDISLGTSYHRSGVAMALP